MREIAVQPAKERGVLMSKPMVQATLHVIDPKTQTRRAVKPQFEREPVEVINGVPSWDSPTNFGGEVQMNTSRGKACPYGRPGERLWVRETFFAFGRWETRFNVKKGRDEWHFIDMTLDQGEVYLYAADGVSDTKAFIKRRSDKKPMFWRRPAIFMPRAASRITLEITDVRVERLQDIGKDDAIAEGIERRNSGGDPCRWRVYGQPDTFTSDPVGSYQSLWESINGAGSWDANPWVWAISFKRIEQGA